MKIIALFLSAVFIALFPSVLGPEADREQAPSAEVLIATPEIDGELDECYLLSYRYTLPKGENLNYAPNKAEAQQMMANTEGTVYYVYDEDYLYACAVIRDETIMSRGEAWRYQTTWPWNDDGAELYFGFSSDHMFAIHTDALGIRSVVDEKIWGNNHSSAKIYHDTPKEEYAVSRPEENVYIIEICVALDEGMKAGDEIGLFLEIDDRYSESGTGALFPANRDPMAKPYLVKLSREYANVSAYTEEEILAVQAFTEYAVNRFVGIIDAGKE